MRKILPLKIKEFQTLALTKRNKAQTSKIEKYDSNDLTTVMNTKGEESEPSYMTPGVDYNKKHNKFLVSDRNKRRAAFERGDKKFDVQEIDKVYMQKYRSKFNLNTHDLVPGFDHERFGASV